MRHRGGWHNRPGTPRSHRMVITHPIRLFFLLSFQDVQNQRTRSIIHQKIPPLLDTPAEKRPIGGLGVHFIRTVTDSVTYGRGQEERPLDGEEAAGVTLRPEAATRAPGADPLSS